MGGLRTGGRQFFPDSNARLWRWGFPVLDVDGLASLQYFPSQEHSKRKAWQEVADGEQQLTMTPHVSALVCRKCYCTLARVVNEKVDCKSDAEGGLP